MVSTRRAFLAHSLSSSVPSPTSASPSLHPENHSPPSPSQLPSKLSRLSRLSPSKSRIPPSKSASLLSVPPLVQFQSVRPTLRPIHNLPSPLPGMSSLCLSASPSVSCHSPNLTCFADIDHSPCSQETPKPVHLNPSKFLPIPFPNVFSHARHLLHLSSVSALENESLVGRAQQFSKLSQFLANRYPCLFDSPTATEKPSTSLYISGSPGTGKTHIVHSVLLNPNHPVHQTLKSAGIKVHLINCVAMGGGAPPGSSGSLAGSLDEELWRKIAMCVGSGETLKAHNKSSIKDLVERSILNHESQPSIIVLDEIDHLATSKRPLITSLLSLSHRAPHANFTLIGIANTLDLTTRLIATSPETSPELIHFSPFDPNEMVEIVKQRLRHLLPSYAHPASPLPSHWASSPAQNLFGSSPASTSSEAPIPLFHPTALTLCAKRVAALTGDLRTFLSILRKLIDNLETSTLQPAEPLDQHSVLDTPTKMRRFGRVISSCQLLPDLATQDAATPDPCIHLTPLNAPKVSASDVIRHLKSTGALAQAAGADRDSESECVVKLAELNLHQSLALVCLCVAWSRGLSGRGAAWDLYRSCLVGPVGRVSEREWVDLVESGLSSKGLVRVEGGLGASITSSRPGTPSRSPSKKKLSMILTTPSKPRQVSTSTTTTPSSRPCTPRKLDSNSQNTSSTGAEPCLHSVYALSVLVKAFKTLGTSQNYRDNEEGGKELSRILGTVLIEEEKKVRKARKRKIDECASVRPLKGEILGEFKRRLGGSEEEEVGVWNRLVGCIDEGGVRDG